MDDESLEPNDDDPARSAVLRERLVDVNDGIVAAAGIVQGFASAGALDSVVLVAGVAALVTGAIAIGGSRYTEKAADLDAHHRLVADERRRLLLDPAAELEELVTLYRAKGLDEPLARQVAAALMEHDPLTAQLDAEYRLALDPPAAPLSEAIWGAAMFVLGALVPLVLIMAAPDSWRVAFTYAAVALALAGSALVAARFGHTSVWRALARTVGIGLGTMLLTVAAGSMLDLRSATVDVDFEVG